MATLAASTLISEAIVLAGTVPEKVSVVEATPEPVMVSDLPTVTNSSKVPALTESELPAVAASTAD